jgi:hypothetical protein
VFPARIKKPMTMMRKKALLNGIMEASIKDIPLFEKADQTWKKTKKVEFTPVSGESKIGR